MFLGAGIFNIFNPIRVFPITGMCHLSGISGSVKGLATHVHACRIFCMILSIQGKMLKIGVYQLDDKDNCG